jgi:hypothetical protein
MSVLREKLPAAGHVQAPLGRTFQLHGEYPSMQSGKIFYFIFWRENQSVSFALDVHLIELIIVASGRH